VAKRRRRRRAAAGKRATAQDAPQPVASTDPAVPAKTPAQRSPRRNRTSAAGEQRALRAPGALGPRPQAPWHPLPLSELLIFVGMIGILVGFARGEAGQLVLLAGVAAVLLGTLEFTIREHLSGYRSHASLLASLPTALGHGLFALVLFAFGAPTAALVIVPLALDVPVFTFLFRLLRARFQDARRERVFAGER
jgi:hypothetical protein